MRIATFALSFVAVFATASAAFAQAVTEPTEAPAPLTAPVEVEAPDEATAPSVAPQAVTIATTPDAATVPTEPTDRVVVEPEQPRLEIGQIDLQALTEEEEVPFFVLDGYYRARANFHKELDLNADTGESINRYFSHRLRLRPRFNLNKNVAVNMLVDALDDQVWGANPGNVLTQSTADTSSNVIVKRAWGEITLPFGRLEAGRMPSHWGMGLLSNDGNGFRNIFGDAHGGSTFDRVMFATKPLGVDSNWITAIVYDKLVADEPAGQVAIENIAVDEFVGVVFFNTDPLKFGVYQLYRFQNDTDTVINATDGYFKLDLGLLYAETEHVWLYGTSEAIPVLNQADFSVSNPPVDINQYGYAAKVGLKLETYGMEMEWGNATGDRNGFADVNPETGRNEPEVTNFKFNSDYNVGLLMFDYANRNYADQALAAQVAGLNTLAEQGIVSEDVIAEVLSVADLARTNGSVTNAFYIFPKLRFFFLEDRINTTLAYVYASANAPRVIQTQSGPKRYDSYGHEFDIAIDFNWTRNFIFGLQGGWLNAGNYFNRQDFITGAIERPDDAYLAQGRFTVLFD